MVNVGCGGMVRTLTLEDAETVVEECEAVVCIALVEAACRACTAVEGVVSLSGQSSLELHGFVEQHPVYPLAHAKKDNPLAQASCPVRPRIMSCVADMLRPGTDDAFRRAPARSNPRRRLSIVLTVADEMNVVVELIFANACTRLGRLGTNILLESDPKWYTFRFLEECKRVTEC